MEENVIVTCDDCGSIVYFPLDASGSKCKGCGKFISRPTNNVIEVYSDGGVIGSNPSMIGGTYAYRLVMDDGQCVGQGNVLTTHLAGGPVTNNQTEMIAVLAGFSQVPDNWVGTIYSDSQVTLGRIFLGWKWKNIPPWMHKFYQAQRNRLKYWNKIKYVLLDGHPTKAQLEAGIGKRGHPVSEHNVWCDQACRKAGEDFLAKIAENIPQTQEAILF